VHEIDPKDFGRMQAEIEALRRENDRQMRLLERLEGQLTSIEEKLSEARGGWRMLMLLGGAAATVGGGLMAIAHKVFKVLG